jgi:tryptophan 2,3-dioxygenase
MSQASEDFDSRSCPATRPSDYERYLNTVELLELQKAAGERVHRDELLFQVVHQSSELWLKLATSEVEEAARLAEAGEVAEAARMLRRPLRCMRYVTDQLDMLEELLRRGSTRRSARCSATGAGFDSPGWRSLARACRGSDRHSTRADARQG